MIALDHLKEGWGPEVIRRNHYDALTLGEIHAALSYYFDHQAKVDTEILRESADR